MRLRDNGAVENPTMTLLKATLIIECPQSDVTSEDAVEAWSYIARTSAHRHPGAFYSHGLRILLEKKVLEVDGTVLEPGSPEARKLLHWD
jgi:hypothetical protein